MTTVTPRTVLIAGASGLIGGALVPFLQAQGHTVRRLVRRLPRRSDEVFWRPATGEIGEESMTGVDAVVNLSGENVGAGRWTARRKEAILRSRVDATRTLVRAMEKVAPRPEVFVSASAVGYYGDRGEEILTEASGTGAGFLAEVCRVWEKEAGGAARWGVRVVTMRMGVVLTPAGGALAKLLPVFRAGFGGEIGGGRQWMSWIGVDDAVGAIHHAITQRQCVGAMNGVAPEPVTNAEFTRTLAGVLRRPAIVPVPAFVLRTVFGRMADETLLASGRAVPAKLEDAGYVFRERSLEGALMNVLKR